MASISRDRNGLKRIQFVSTDGRKSIRLGKTSMRQANAVKVMVESLVSTRRTGQTDNVTAQWISELDDEMYDKLAAVGLVDPRKNLLLGQYIHDYIKNRTDIKTATTTVLGHTKRNMIDFFGEDKPLRDISQGDADLWRVYLKEQGLSENTIRRRCGIAKQFFKAAVRSKYIQSNPFADLKSAVHGNESRLYFVSRDEIDKVLDQCPDMQWRVIIALARYGGFRCPSEVLSLKWTDIDWDQGKILIHSPKTEHHPNGESRLVPLFPEVRAILLDAFEQAQEGDEYVVTRYRDRTANLRTQFHRIIRQAGLEPWAKPFQNLRSTRQTELEERWPSHVVCAWMGNSQAVARKHYLQVTDDHFEQAVQNEAQYPAVQGGMTKDEKSEKAVLHELTSPYETAQSVSMGDTGLEPVTPCV